MVALYGVVPWPRGVSEVQVGSACGPSTLWRSEVAVSVVRRCFSHGCSVSLVVTPVASACVDSAGSAGVIFGLTRVVVEAFLCFHCFVVLCGRRFSLYCFVE
ncbi:hypothetical protein Taro_020514 [Colocasia esculenta]|uniref:Uncharacterized protein n=1 Tax=Colocasia esculenta TaxID=4460 RepID=A0A843UNW2_COLES|nr:hypothetical protein [Colocasia esculenta]